ncbi:MAG: SDR family oxidoreductase [Deltaproteobacteria bacterium]|nr:MAG: SDR family oxidoreductase [Deltaproteobacteria bacterium]
MNLKKKTVLITGGAQRIGREMALHFAKKGANVLIHYHHSLKEATCLICELRSLGVQAKAYRADLTRVADLKRMVEKIVRDFGGIDILVHNASLFYPVDFEKVLEKNWDDFLNIHLKAPFFLIQSFLPSLKKKKEASIILIGDRTLSRPKARFLPYEISKEALKHLSRKLAVFLAPKIRVACVQPGLILPPKNLSPAAQKRLARENLLKSWGCEEDVARAVIFLAEQPFVTGTEIVVDGGQSLVSRL